MSFDTLEKSRQGGQPVEFYQFYQGPLARPEDMFPPPAPTGGTLVLTEPWTYSETGPGAPGTDVFDFWPAVNVNNLMGGSPAGGTGGTFTMNDLRFIGGIGSGGARVYHERVVSGLNPACPYMVTTQVTRNRETGWFRSGIQLAGEETAEACWGGAGTTDLYAITYPAADGTLTIRFGVFLCEYGGFTDNPLDLTLGPINLYRMCSEDVGPLVFGGGRYFNHTSADEDFTFRGELYTPELIVRDSLKYDDNETDAMDLTVDVALGTPLALAACSPPPALPIVCHIYLAHRQELTSYIAPLRTQVRRAIKVGNKARLTLTPIVSLYDKEIPARMTQKKCDHRLYGHLCQATTAGHVFTDLEVAAISGRTLTVTGAAALAGGFPTRFREGVLVAPDGSLTGIMGYNADDPTNPDAIILYDRNNAITVGCRVKLIDGCTKELSVCHGLYGNAINYGGEPLVPLKSPGDGGGWN